MYCVIYRSVAEPTIKQSDILDLLEQAKDFNRTNDITGCLLYYNHEFVQYLEGDSITITNLFKKIKKDARHKNVKLLFKGHIYSREFEDWTMAYENFIKPNRKIKHLKMIVDSCFNNSNLDKRLNPTTKKFWALVKGVLWKEYVEKFK